MHYISRITYWSPNYQCSDSPNNSNYMIRRGGTGMFCMRNVGTERLVWCIDLSALVHIMFYNSYILIFLPILVQNNLYNTKIILKVLKYSVIPFFNK